MDYKIFWSERSLINLRNILQFIPEENPFAAEKMGTAVVNKVLPLAQFPLIGKVFSKLGREDIREISAPPYRIIYQVLESHRTISILTVWHGARLDPELS